MISENEMLKRNVYKLINNYKKLETEQVIAFFSSELTRTVINKLIGMKKIYNSADKKYVYISEDYINKSNFEIINSFWVVIDFKEKIDFHTKSRFPVQISFFTKKMNCMKLFI